LPKNGRGSRVTAVTSSPLTYWPGFIILPSAEAFFGAAGT
jgi:hypothetical protein